MSGQAPEVYDLLILVDATYSMSSYLTSLQKSLPQIISITTLTDCFSRIGLLAYRDYCDKDLLEWSGWLTPSSFSTHPQVDLLGKAKALYPIGGGDAPEATKTGLAKAYEVMRKEATTIILLYTDAPPHTSANGSKTADYSNFGPELAALTEHSYGGTGGHFSDWVSASRWLSMRTGEKKAQVFCILEGKMPFNNAGYYNYLATMTGGACLYLADSEPASISKITIEVLLAWMGVEKLGVSADVSFPAYLSRYIKIDNIKKLNSETDPQAKSYFQVTASVAQSNLDGTSNITKVRASSQVLKKHIPKKASPVTDFAKRYTWDANYKKITVEHLKRIIIDDVTTISLNPVFGSLWRAVCNDRSNKEREEVIASFGLHVDRIMDANEKARMKQWLEESYDYTAEVLDIIHSVPEDRRFPCVCLDPTLTFPSGPNSIDKPDQDGTAAPFKRDELLEIGRSCDGRILRRLGRVLTQLTYINSAKDVPFHLAAALDSETPMIPIALASPKYKRQFWRILLHVVVPGTMLSARPAALLAALSIRMGIEPLLQAANQEMLLWRDRWNDLDIPENWNSSCLGLLLDADDAHSKRAQDATACLGDQKSAEAVPHSPSSSGLLKPGDRALFELLVFYKMVEINLDTTLTAKIGWTPEKATAALGPTVVCQSCHLPRSVTIMGEAGKCGHCLRTSYLSPDDREAHINARVKKDDNSTTPATWVECNIRTCRAQYVVYRPENLNVRPKCYYCRQSGKPPVVECSDCLNRVIWPKTYIPKNMDMSAFKCYACGAGRKTVVEVETTANRLKSENGLGWLLRNENKILEPFNGRSLFHLISTSGMMDFRNKVELLPSGALDTLTLNGKLIRNANDVVNTLRSWAERRTAESGCCSLCFSSSRKNSLVSACKRRGCFQTVCRECLQSWYGLNRAGKIVNTAALSCPFCRRAPTAHTLSKYGIGIHAVGNLAAAVAEQGSWIYAWCSDCGHAKQYVERICAAGAPPDLDGWVCDGCSEQKSGQQSLKIKPCPSCETMTEKISGCGHITCTVCSDCHWCFYCGKRFTSSTIYSHMNDSHGGFFGEEDATVDEDGDNEGYNTD